MLDDVIPHLPYSALPIGVGHSIADVLPVIFDLDRSAKFAHDHFLLHMKDLDWILKGDIHNVLYRCELSAGSSSSFVRKRIVEVRICKGCLVVVGVSIEFQGDSDRIYKDLAVALFGPFWAIRNLDVWKSSSLNIGLSRSPWVKIVYSMHHDSLACIWGCRPPHLHSHSSHPPLARSKEKLANVGAATERLATNLGFPQISMCLGLPPSASSAICQALLTLNGFGPTWDDAPSSLWYGKLGEIPVRVEWIAPEEIGLLQVDLWVEDSLAYEVLNEAMVMKYGTPSGVVHEGRMSISEISDVFFWNRSRDSGKVYVSEEARRHDAKNYTHFGKRYTWIPLHKKWHERIDSNRHRAQEEERFKKEKQKQEKIDSLSKEIDKL